MHLALRTDHIEEDVLQGGILIVSAGSLAQFLQRPFSHQRSLVDNADPRAETLDHFHDVR